ncbi:hypothetical protein RvY_12138 [Ramazzottius varieornatus]|uniref:Uncharacterized protein n=1 Tax=Ramazzottius varieornatus TaxID=947166 RepID=A0A1D1VR47_RAMVA|nr:hypothetical protein RvY_12138 [Ramazzottius varieornatus]
MVLSRLPNFALTVDRKYTELHDYLSTPIFVQKFTTYFALTRFRYFERLFRDQCLIFTTT